MKKLSVFCLIASILSFTNAYGDTIVNYTTEDFVYVEDLDHNFSDSFIFESEDTCNKYCGNNCSYSVKTYKGDKYAVCPPHWKRGTGLCDGRDCVKCYFNWEEYGAYTETIIENNGVYSVNYTGGYQGTSCKPCFVTADGNSYYFCDNGPEDTSFCENTGCVAKYQNMEKTLDHCLEGYYFDSSTESCLPCGSIEKDGKTYQLTSDTDDNKRSREEACYVDNANTPVETRTDDRGTYELRSGSGGVCTVKMLGAN